MSTIGPWFALSMTYLVVHVFLMYIAEMGLMEVLVARQSGPGFLVSLVFTVRHALLSFVSAMATTLLGRWWFDTPALSHVVLLTAICPLLVLISFIRFAGGSGFVVSWWEFFFSLGIALLMAYLAVDFGLRLQLA